MGLYDGVTPGTNINGEYDGVSPATYGEYVGYVLLGLGEYVGSSVVMYAPPPPPPAIPMVDGALVGYFLSLPLVG